MSRNPPPVFPLRRGGSGAMSLAGQAAVRRSSRIAAMRNGVTSSDVVSGSTSIMPPSSGFRSGGAGGGGSVVGRIVKSGGVATPVSSGQRGSSTSVSVTAAVVPVVPADEGKLSEVVNTLSQFNIGKGNSNRETRGNLFPPKTNNHDSNNNQQSRMGESSTSAPEATTLLRNFDACLCEFCSISLGAQEGVMLLDCLHVFCRDCLQAAIEMQTDATRIPCPVAEEFKCNGFLSDAEVKLLVAPDAYQEYLDRSLVIAKKKIKNVFNCHTPKCPGWCEFEEGRKTFACPVCSKVHCLHCNALHSGVDCETYKTLSRNGQLHKLEEMVEKETKNGWAQLTAMMEAGGGDTALTSRQVLEKMADTDLLLNTLSFECPVCFGDIPAGEGIILHECLHVFCKQCLIDLVDHNDEAVVKCPYIDGNYSCVSTLQEREIRKLLPTNVYDKHLQRSMKLGESSMQNSFHCKTPDCQGWCVYEEGGATRFKCPICHKNNCIPCNAIHSDSCEDYKNRLKQNANDKLSAEAIAKLIKDGKAMRCPRCSIPVEKTAGCDWLQCTACRMEICWVTRGPRWGPKGYGDTSGGCRCRVGGKKCHPKCHNCH